MLAEFKEFLFQKGEYALEPHWSLTGRRYPFETDYEGFWRRARRIRLGSASLRVFAPEDLLVVLCLVGAKGRWQRLQMVCDVAECLRTYPELDWPAVIARAKETGTVRILCLALRLAHSLAGASLPAGLEAWVQAPAISRLEGTFLRELQSAGDVRRFLPAGPGIFSPLLFRQRERARDRWLYLLRTTTTPTPLHLERMPLPRAIDWLYRVLVPLHDYVAVPLWHVFTPRVERAVEPSPNSVANTHVPNTHEPLERGTLIGMRPIRSARTEIQEVGDEVLVLDRSTESLHRLNATAAWIFERCDGETDPAAIADELVEAFAIDRAVAEEDVALTLEQLRERGLISFPRP
jgi:hypothetical protein